MQSRSQRIQKKVFAKRFFSMRLLSYSILHYILKFSVHKIYFYDLRISPRGLYYCNRYALDKICEIYTFDRCPHGCLVLAKNHFWLVATRKKRIGEQLKEKSRGPLLARAALNAASLGYN